MVRKKYSVIGILLFLGGTICFLFPRIEIIYKNKKIDMDIQSMYENRDSYFSKKDTIAILDIPSLPIKNYLYNEDSIFNHVNQNVYVVPDSTMPDTMNSNLILASHSGYGESAYFRNLDKLKVGDIAFIYYQNQKYRYRYVSFYQEEKDGTIVIHREKGKKHLTLVTCDTKNKNLQNIYVFELISVEQV